MAISANAIAGGALAAIGAIFLAITTPAGWAGQSDRAVAAAPVAPAPSIAAGGGVTLHSVSIDLPDSNGSFPGGAAADAVNNDCLACHSAGMVLTQPALSRAAWQAEVDKMRETYKAPIAPEDVPAIVDYLAKLKRGK